MLTRDNARRARFGALLIGALVAGLMVATPAEAAVYGIKVAPSKFAVATKSPSRMAFSWARPISAGVQKVKYTVTIAGNRNMRKDANYAVKTGYGYTRTSTTSTARDTSPVFEINQPTLRTFGARIWVKVVTTTIGGKYTKADPQKASNRYSAGLQPADPALDNAVVVTPTCKGLTARWAPGQKPEGARGLKVEVSGAGGTTSYVGYEPSNTVTVSSLAANTAYRVRVQATSVKQRSAYTNYVSVTTSRCASRVVRVGSYNLQKQGANPVSWTTRAPRAASEIVRMDSDIVGLQEAPSYSYKQVQKLQSELKERGKPYSRADASNGGVHLIYRNDRFQKVGFTEYYDGNVNNAIAVAQAFKAKTGSNPTFIVVSVHSTTGNQGEVAKGIALAEEVKVTNRLNDSTPVIFTGDVVLADTEEKRTGVRAELSKTMSDAEFYKPGRALDLYNSRNALKTCPPHVSGIKVDGIFTSDTAAVTSWTMPQYGFSRGCFRKGFPSDHNLLSANVWVPIV